MKRAALLALLLLAFPLVYAETWQQADAGALGLSFNIIGNDMGSPAYPDPKTSGIDTIAGSGLGINWFISKNLRLHGAIDFQFNDYGYSNEDSAQVMALGLAADLDFPIIRTGPVMLYVGPFVEGDWITAAYTTYATSTTQNVQGYNVVGGALIGADCFFCPQFSIGAYCPVTVRYVWTTTSVNVQSPPTEFNIVGFQGLYATLSYYF